MDKETQVHDATEQTGNPAVTATTAGNEFAQEADSGFPLFSSLPVELRSKIWEAGITPRIIKCKRADDQNVFTGPSKPNGLLGANQESRIATFLYGEYAVVSTSPTVYFSPKYDYLWIDAGWTSLSSTVPSAPPFILPPTNVNLPTNFNGLASPPNGQRPTQPPHLRHDFNQTFSPEVLKLRNIMIHPNWSTERMKPTVLFAKFPELRCILVVADERSIGIQNKLMIDTTYDIKMYYAHIANQGLSKAKLPRIAVGCLGWTGDDRMRLHHPSQDNRQLVAVFDNSRSLTDHLQVLREKERMFIRQLKGPKSSLLLKLQRAQELMEKGEKPHSSILNNGITYNLPAKTAGESSDPSPKFEERRTTSDPQQISEGPPGYDDVMNTDVSFTVSE